MLVTFPIISHAAIKTIDARSGAMGNTGVASADYLTASLYNPALLSNFHDDDDVGVLVPAVGVNLSDLDDSADDLIDLQDAISDFEDGGFSDYEKLDEIDALLDNLEGNRSTTVSANAGFAVAIPSSSLSFGFFGKGSVETIAIPSIAENRGGDHSGRKERYENSNVELKAFAVSELGVSLSKKFHLGEHQFSIGVSPKFQQIRTYSTVSPVAIFEIEEVEESLVEKSQFNADIGLAYYHGESVVLGVSATDLVATKIDVNDVAGGRIGSYSHTPMVNLGLAYNGEFFSTAIDAELLKREGFDTLGDESKYVKFGVETNMWDWVQLRAGYQYDVASNVAGVVTAGIGVSPFDLLGLDVAASYSGDNQLGLSASVSATF